VSAKRLPRSFYARPAEIVAPDLLGKVLCHRLHSQPSGHAAYQAAPRAKDDVAEPSVATQPFPPRPRTGEGVGGEGLPPAIGDIVLSGRIVEVEAYKGQLDPGSHAFRGETRRNRVMFGPAGYVYIYISYGQHRCMNVVTESPGVAGAVLIRALEPIEGIPVMEDLRGGKPLVDLANGPGKLCQALGITLADNGDDLEGDEIWVEDDGFRPAEIATSTRVGLTAGADMELRFYVPGNPYVSKGRPSGFRPDARP